MLCMYNDTHLHWDIDIDLAYNVLSDFMEESSLFGLGTTMQLGHIL
jgi:hypothetical protein